MERVVYIGKFQPFHKGHNQVVSDLSEEFDEVIVVIGGAEKSFSTTYVFRAGERVEMINNSAGSNVDYIIPVPDIHNNAVWTEHINQYTPEYTCVYSNNPLVQRLYSNSDTEVRSITMKDRENLSGTRIRKRMLNDKKWKHLVPNACAEVIEKYNGIKRIQELAKDDQDFSK